MLTVTERLLTFYPSIYTNHGRIARGAVGYRDPRAFARDMTCDMALKDEAH